MLQDCGLVTASERKPVEICVVPITKNEVSAAERVARELRSAGKTVDLVLSEKKLGDKMKYASRVARYVAVIGEDEAKSGEYELRELQ